MPASTHTEPTYIVRLTNDLAVRWTLLSIVLFIAAAAGVSAFYGAIHGQPWSLSNPIERDRTWQILLTVLAFVGIPMGTFIIHELIHGLAFTMFGGNPRYGVGVKLFVPYAYATSPGDRFSRNAFIAIGLAPLVVIDLVCLMLLALFPQAVWLGWVIVLNTSGASGDLWIATLLLRSPRSIRVEDRQTGVAIYTPSTMDRRSLPFPTANKTSHSIFWSWFNITLAILVGLITVIFFLPLLFLILQVPSFVVGTDALWILRWESSSEGFGIGVNPFSVLAIAVGIGLVGFLIQRMRHH